jgi:peptidoglycan-associated lipoprotein
MLMTKKFTHERLRVASVVVVVAGMLLSAGCAKKVAKATPAAPPPASATPTATLAANPSTIEQGQSTTLTWQTTHATEVTIAGLGTLPASGSRSVAPGTSTSYTLVAAGPGGTNDASARVTVNQKTAASYSPSDEELFAKNVRDVFFDYNVSNIRPDETTVAHQDAAFLKQHPSVNVLIEGHCDDRGSIEYNLALGTSRAESVKQALLQQGVPADRLKTISYGKEKPFCKEDDEQCWQQNRVDHFTLAH